MIASPQNLILFQLLTYQQSLDVCHLIKELLRRSEMLAQDKNLYFKKISARQQKKKNFVMQCES